MYASPDSDSVINVTSLWPHVVWPLHTHPSNLVPGCRLLLVSEGQASRAGCGMAAQLYRELFPFISAPFIPPSFLLSGVQFSLRDWAQAAAAEETASFCAFVCFSHMLVFIENHWNSLFMGFLWINLSVIVARNQFLTSVETICDLCWGFLVLKWFLKST